MNASVLRVLATVCFYAGFASILVAVLVWVFFRSPDAAYGERFGIFIGLWAPTFFILSDRFDRYAAPKAP